MIPTLKLMHPKLGLVTQLPLISKSREKQEEEWKNKYGKKYLECSTVLEGKESKLSKEKRKIVHIYTRQVFEDAKAASKEFDVSPHTIMQECLRNRDIGFHYTFKFE